MRWPLLSHLPLSFVCSSSLSTSVSALVIFAPYSFLIAALPPPPSPSLSNILSFTFFFCFVFSLSSLTRWIRHISEHSSGTGPGADPLQNASTLANSHTHTETERAPK